MLHYQCASDGITLTEQKNNDDIEFTITIQDTERYLPAMKLIREHYDGDNIFTDVLFYVHKGHEYQVIVRPDYYVDFILNLFKYRMVLCIAWI